MEVGRSDRESLACYHPGKIQWVKLLYRANFSAFLYINISGYASLLGNEWRTGLDIASFYNTASVK